MMYWGTSTRSALWKLVWKWNLAIARRVITNDSASSEELTSRWSVPGSKIRNIPFCVDTVYFSPASKPSRDFILIPGDGKRDEDFVLSFANRFGMRLVRSTKSVDVARLYEGFTDQNIQVKLFAPFSEIRWNSQNARAVLLLLQSHSEPVGLTALLESMACGTPCITNESRITRDHVRDGETGFVLKGPRETWLAQLKRILANPMALDIAGRRAREYVEQRHAIYSAAPVWQDALFGS